MIHALLISWNPSTDHHLHHHASFSSVSLRVVWRRTKMSSERQRYQPLYQHANVKPFFKSRGLSPGCTKEALAFLETRYW